MFFGRRLFLALIAALLAVTAPAPGCGPKTVRTGHRGVEGTLKDVRFFSYQIQGQEEGNNIRKLADSRYDMLVTDQTRSLKGEEDYESAADVLRLKDSKSSSGRKKVVVSYIDVGEAESYRRYWRDGIYLDWLEAYSFEPVAKVARSEGLDPRTELVKFVRELARRARSKKPGFLLMAQNAAELGSVPEYVELFDAVAQESVWYEWADDPDTGGVPGDVPVDPENTEELLRDLALW